MKLTRKQLNQILLTLPHPNLVIQGRITPVLQVPVFEPMSLIPDRKYDGRITEVIHHLTFEYSAEEMDWVLKDLIV